MTSSLIRTIKSPNPTANDYFGSVTIVDGNYIVIPDRIATVAGQSYAGQVVLYNTTTGTTRTITSPTPTAYDQFGYSTPIVDENYIVIGDPNATVAGKSQAGQVVVYNTTTGTTRTIKSPNPTANDWFGYSTPIVDGNLILIEDQNATVGGRSWAGQVVVYNTTTDTTSTITSPTPTYDDFFGYPTPIVDGNYIVIPDRIATVAGQSKAGQVVVYNTITGTTRTITSPTPTANEQFGSSLQIDGNYIVIRDPYATVGGRSWAGQVVVYNTTTGTTRTIKSPNPIANEQFGSSLQIDGNYIVIGDQNATVAGQSKAGQVVVYNTITGTTSNITAPTPIANDQFGSSTPIVDGNYIVIGDQNATVGGRSWAGQVVVYNTTTGATSTITSPNPIANDQFGSSTPIVDGNYIVIPEPYATVAGQSKAGQVVVYNTTTGATSAITAPNPTAYEQFGLGTSIGNGNLILIRDPGATVAGQSKAGQVVVYNTTTGATSAITAPNPTAYDDFGSSTPIVDGNLILIPAPGATVAGQTRAGQVVVYNTTTGATSAFTSPNPIANDDFGSSTPIVDGNYIVIGDQYATVAGKSQAGQVVVYNTTTGATSTITAPNPTANEQFGDYIPIVDGNYILIPDPGATVAGQSYAGQVLEYSLSSLPVITLPTTSPTVSDGIPTTITGITVGDLAGTAEKLTLKVAHGTLTFGTTTGLTVTGNGSKSVIVTGTLANLQTDLATLSYTGKAPYNGSDTLSLALTDTTDKLTTNSSLALTAQYNPPTITLPTKSPTVTKGIPTTITGITVGDLAGTAEKLALSVGHGTLTFGTNTGLTVTSGSYGTKSVTVTGNLADLQTDLATLSYTSGVSYKGKDTLSLGLTDTTDKLTTKSSLAFTVVPPSII